MILAHITGIPIEETALSFGPVLAAGGGIATLMLRERFARGRAAAKVDQGRWRHCSCSDTVTPSKGTATTTRAG